MTIQTTRFAAIVILALAVAGTLGSLSPALADQAAEPPPAATAGEYHSPLRATWRDEVRADPGLKADIEGALREGVHTRESATFTRNNRHVVIAYIAIWVLTVGFVVMMFLRQGKLQAEIARLSGELARAAKDGGA